MRSDPNWDSIIVFHLKIIIFKIIFHNPKIIKKKDKKNFRKKKLGKCNSLHFFGSRIKIILGRIVSLA